MRAQSSGETCPDSACCASIFSRSPGLIQSSSCLGVMTAPGTSEFTRIADAPVHAPFPGEAVDRGLGGLVDRNGRGHDHPADRAEVDDRSAPRLRHARRHRLDGKEEVLEIDRHALVPIGRGHIGPFVPLVMRGIVDENAGRAMAGREPGNGRPQRLGVGDVARGEGHLGAVRPKLLGKRRAGVGGEVDKSDPRTLGREGAHHGSADARGTARDDHGAARKAWICGRHHGVSVTFRPPGPSCAE